MDKISKEGNGNVISLMAVGGIMLGGRVPSTLQRHKAGWIFGDVKNVLSGADLAFGNLEAPLVNSKIAPDYKRKYLLGAREEVVNDLKAAGFTVLSMCV
jgi:poly-gamma-glutamate capsule biosynthesis protein CapA/YwtB (metallophosphatase superfamily)